MAHTGNMNTIFIEYLYGEFIRFRNMMQTILFLLFTALVVAPSSADVIPWAQSQGSISKGFDDASVDFTLTKHKYQRGHISD
ncbi:MAG: hypothetical protein ACI957_002858 [Verrucomicrobiales bacterium]